MSSLADRAAQLIFPRLGSNMQPPVTVDEDIDRAERLLESVQVGGFILFNGRLAGLPDALGRLQKASKFPLLFGSDIERGTGQQVKGATVFPHSLAFSELGDESETLLESVARVTAREALAAGIHIAFAPVADIHNNPRNPIISIRAFGRTPEEAGRLVRAYIRGAQKEGLLTTAKHFPGHGNTDEDSHATLPVLRASREDLLRTELAPFRDAIDAGVDLIMTAHLGVPALDPDASAATLSAPILVDFLRGEMGFKGAVVSDSLLMSAVQATHPIPGDQAVALVRAGVDMLLDPQDPVAFRDGIVRAVEDGKLDEGRLDEAVARVDALRQKMVHRFGRDAFGGRPSFVPEAGAGVLAREVARRAVKLKSGRQDQVTLDPSRRLAFLFIQPHRTHLDPETAPFVEAVRASYPGADCLQLGPDAGVRDYESAAEAAMKAECVVVALVVRPAAWRAYGLLPDQQTFVWRLTEKKPVIVASLGSPDVLDAFPAAAATICTFSDVPVSQTALVDFLYPH